MLFRDIPQWPRSYYEVDVGWDYLEDWLGRIDCDIDPDFQRAHVWAEEQQVAYVEYRLHGGESGRSLYWNNPEARGTWGGTTVLVDGKQRLEAVRKFVRDELIVLGQRCSEFGKIPGMDTQYSFRMHVCCLKTRAEVLQWYLHFNSGGTDHTPEEIAKVRALLDKEITS